MELTPIESEVLQLVFRWFIGLLVSGLATRHIITADQGASLTDDLIHRAILFSPALIPLGWGVYKVVMARAKLMTALMPGVHTEDQVNAIVKNGVTPSLSTPPNTVPSVPAQPTGLSVDLTKVGKP